MKPYYINENTTIKTVHDPRRELVENNELTTRLIFEEHGIAMNIVCGDPSKHLNTIETNVNSMKTLVIEGRKDFRARTPDQIKEFEDEEKDNKGD